MKQCSSLGVTYTDAHTSKCTRECLGLLPVVLAVLSAFFFFTQSGHVFNYMDFNCMVTSVIFQLNSLDLLIFN